MKYIPRRAIWIARKSTDGHINEAATRFIMPLVIGAVRNAMLKIAKNRPTTNVPAFCGLLRPQTVLNSSPTL